MFAIDPFIEEEPDLLTSTVKLVFGVNKADLAQNG